MRGGDCFWDVSCVNRPLCTVSNLLVIGENLSLSLSFFSFVYNLFIKIKTLSGTWIPHIMVFTSRPWGKFEEVQFVLMNWFANQLDWNNWRWILKAIIVQMNFGLISSCCLNQIHNQAVTCVLTGRTEFQTSCLRDEVIRSAFLTRIFPPNKVSLLTRVRGRAHHIIPNKRNTS